MRLFKVFVELNNSLNTFSENIQSEILVGRVNGIALQTKSHKNGFNAKNLFISQILSKSVFLRFFQPCFAKYYKKSAEQRLQQIADFEKEIISLEILETSENIIERIGKYPILFTSVHSMKQIKEE